MKSLLKKGFCALLCIALIACGIVPAFAADTTPVVLVPGVMNTPIYDDATGNQVLMPDFKRQLDIEGTITALKEVLHLQDTGAYDQAIDELITVAKGLFDEARCDENGNPVIPSHHVKANGSIAADTASAHYSDESAIARQIGQTIGNRNVYIFTYDWRLDIIGIVDGGLAPLIERVKQETKYGDRNDVKKAIFLSSAGQGVQFVKDIYCTKPVFVNRKAMAPYFKTVLGAAGGIGISAVSNYLCQIAQKLMDSQYDKLWTQFVEKDLLCWPSMWELAGHSQEMESMLKATKNATFQNKVMEYYHLQDGLKNTLDGLKKKGVEICYTSKLSH